jgi:hypothetical protein
MKKTIYIILTLILFFPMIAQGQNTKAAPSAKDGVEQNADTDKCGAITEGGSTIEKLSRLEGAMSVRNLEFKYFDKFLFNLTDQDFNELKTLKPSCDGSAEEIAVMIFDKLKQKISEAKETRDSTINWMEKTKKELQSLSASPTAVKKIHNTWKDMESRSQEMLNDDLKYFAKFLNQIRRRVYEESAKQPSDLVKPFYPIKNLND